MTANQLYKDIVEYIIKFQKGIDAKAHHTDKFRKVVSQLNTVTFKLCDIYFDHESPGDILIIHISDELNPHTNRHDVCVMLAPSTFISFPPSPYVFYGECQVRWIMG